MQINRYRDFWIDSNARSPYYYPEASVQGYGLSLIAKDQPEYVCRDCGAEFGYWTSNGHGIDKGKCHSIKDDYFHEGNCDCCGKEFSLTHVKNYGYFYDGWQYKNK